MKAKGELYPHRHEPIISYELFERVEEVREGHNKKPFQYVAKPFIFRGMITCGYCGCLVSPEMKESKYVYYSCTNAKGICKRDYINETAFLQEVAHYFDDIRLPEETIQEITAYLKQIYESEGKFYQEQKARLRKEQDQIQQRLSKMYDDRYDGRIDESLFQKKLNEYKERERAIIQGMERHVNSDESFHITANMVLNLARRAREIFESSEIRNLEVALFLPFQNSQRLPQIFQNLPSFYKLFFGAEGSS